MSDNNAKETTEKKPAARATRSRSRSRATARSRSHRRTRTPNANANGGEGADQQQSPYQIITGHLNQYCSAKRITAFQVNIFEWLAYLQENEAGQIAQGRTMAAGQR